MLDMFKIWEFSKSCGLGGFYRSMLYKNSSAQRILSLIIALTLRKAFKDPHPSDLTSKSMLSVFGRTTTYQTHILGVLKQISHSYICFAGTKLLLHCKV